MFDRAERHYHRAWDIQARLLGPDHETTLAVRNNYVWTVVTQGRRPDAEGLAQAALDDSTRTLGESHAETGKASNNLSEVFLHTARYDEAVVLRRRALGIMVAALGPGDERTLEVANDLGVALITAGRPAEAIPILRATADHRRQLDPRNLEYATVLNNLGGGLIGAGQFAEAEAPLREAVARRTAAIGADFQGTLAARNLLGYAQEGQGRWAEAESSYLAVLADRRRVAGPGRPDMYVLRTVGFLARLYAKQERWPDAARYLAELILAEKPGPGRTIDNIAPPLATALDQATAPAGAGAVLREAHEVVKMRMWKGDWLTAEVGSRYGDCLRRQGEYAEAEPILLAAAAEIDKAVGVPPRGVAAARRRMIDLYTAWGKPAEAAKWQKAFAELTADQK